jgi:hypothetical protein
MTGSSCPATLSQQESICMATMARFNEILTAEPDGAIAVAAIRALTVVIELSEGMWFVCVCVCVCVCVYAACV